MTKILIKLQEKSTKQFITTQSGYAILRNEWTEVNDDDREIKRILLYRNDIDIKEVTSVEDIKEEDIKEEVIEVEVVSVEDIKEEVIEAEDPVIEVEEDSEEEVIEVEPVAEMSEEDYIELKLKEAKDEKGKPLTKAQKNKIIKAIKN